MRQLFRSIAGAAALLAWSPVAAAQAPSTGGWELKQTPESCYLFRSFTTLSGKMDLRIQSFGPTTPYHVILHGPGLPIRDNRAEVGAIAFGDEADAVQSMVFVGKAGEFPMVVLPAFAPRPAQIMGIWFQGSGDTEFTRVDPTAERLFVDLPDNEPLSLELGPMAGEYARLDTCVDGLFAAWNRTASGDAVPVSMPEMLDGQGMISRIWFPPNLSMNRVSGMVQLRMRVDASGRARDCIVQSWVSSPQFGEKACSAFTEWARFKPAQDAQGNPVDALFRTAIMFVIYRW